MAFAPIYIFVLALLIMFAYLNAKFIEKAKNKKRKYYLTFSVVTILATLGFFKYFNFLAANLKEITTILSWNYSPSLLSVIVPLGLSFQSFFIIAYLTEVYKRTQKAEKNFIVLSLSVMFFPTLTAGPIERPQHLHPQLKKKHRFDYEQIKKGLQSMLWGYFLKLVIADRLALFVNPVYNNPQSYNSYQLAIATLFFAFQIYCDFAGYTYIAIGAAKILGIDLLKNFNKPYFATSVRNFWRRWHITLSSWFRDYLYIPLGGNRKGFLKTCKNVLIVFLLTGLWHGANWTYVIWGLIHGVAITFELIFEKIGFIAARPFTIAITFTIVSFSWIFFRANTLKDAFYITTKLFHFPEFKIEDLYLNHTREDFLMALLVIFFVLWLESTKDNFKLNILKRPVIRWSVYYITIFSILLFGIFSQSKFIYFQF